LGGDLRGGTATADIQDLSLTGTVVVERDAGEITLGGSLIGADANGFDVTSTRSAAAIDANGQLGAVRIGGDILGRTGRPRNSAGGLNAAGANTGFAIRSLNVEGRVERADIPAGYQQVDGTLPGINPVNPYGRIGTIRVGGDLVASNLTAGVNVATGDRIAGGARTPVSRIDSLSIGGVVTGTAAAGDQFLISARLIGQVSVGGAAVGPRSGGPGNDDLVLGPTADLIRKEVT
jgi:hypothetical protein